MNIFSRLYIIEIQEKHQRPQIETPCNSRNVLITLEKIFDDSHVLNGSYHYHTQIADTQIL